MLRHHHHEPGVPAVDKPALVQRPREVLPPKAVLSEPEDLHPYECDGLTAYRKLPMLVTLPGTIEQVQAILRICHGRECPW
jgi:glycolate oxidase